MGMKNRENIQALLIDIDDTITTYPPRPDFPPATPMFALLREAAVLQAGLEGAEADRRIREITEKVQWWRWSDFIVELGLDPRGFWDYAFEREKPYVQATVPDISEALGRLRTAGFHLYITSNNPADGIRHKLRMAGLGDNHRSPLFDQCLGPPELKAMKYDPLFWRRALAHIGFRPEEVAVVGDNLRDDYEFPRSIGVVGTFLFRHDGIFHEPDTDSLVHVSRFSEVADRLLPRKG